MLDTLRRDGISLGLVEAVLPLDLWGALLADVRVVMSNRFAKLQATLESKDRTESKRYLRQWLGRYPMYDPDSVWGRIATHLQPLAEAYLEQPSRLQFYNLWETVPTGQPPSRSQVWHKDHEDTRICKVFVYLSDVHGGAGPLTYATGTHQLGPHGGVAPATYCEVDSGWVRVTDDAMSAVCPSTEWTIAIGPKGTIVIADTAGYHKGGHCTTDTRLLATWEWVSVASKEKSRFHGLGSLP